MGLWLYNLINIGKQSLPTFNLGEILGFISDWKAQQMGLFTLCLFSYYITV